MATEPNTTIKLYRGVPFDIDGKDTLYFASKTDQETYFNGLYSLTFSQQSYQRIDKETLRIQASAERLMDMNYLSFNNVNHGNRTYYAFIVGISYINENTSEIKYVIDDLQSYLFYYDGSTALVQIKDCVIEREHSNTDVAGDNLIDEGLDNGEYVSTYLGGTENMVSASTSEVVATGLKTLDVVIAMPYKYNASGDSFDNYDGGFYAGLYSGVYYNAFDTTVGAELTNLNNCIKRISADSKEDKVVSMFYAPRAFWSGTTPSVSVIDAPPVYIKTFNSYPATFGSYIPKNKKLYTYPFNMLYVVNPTGKSAIYQYEFFSNNVSFELTGSYSCDAEVMLTPENYKGVANNLSEKLTMTGYPQIAFVANSYESWLAQNRYSNALAAVSGISKIAGGAVKMAVGSGMIGGGFVGSGVAAGMRGFNDFRSGFESIEKLYVTNKEQQIDPLQSVGSIANSAMLASGHFDFQFYNKRITEEFAKIIDEYFTKFGYATHRVKKPNLFAGGYTRRYFYYVKTSDAAVRGFAPADVLQRIAAKFDSGITFWLSPAQYGNYSVDNSPR